MKRCPHCGGNVATFCDQCTYCKTIISTYTPKTSAPKQTSPIRINPPMANTAVQSSLISKNNESSNHSASSDNTQFSQSSAINSTLPKRNRSSGLWIYIVIFITTCILFIKTGLLDFCFNVSDSPRSIYIALILTLFLGGFVFSFLTPIVIMICLPIEDAYFRHMCPHGIWNGEKAKNGKMKCPHCQTYHDEQTRLQQKLRIQQQLQEKYQKQYLQDLANAIEKRKKTLAFDSKSIHDMTPQAFEDMIAILFRKLGYQVEQTPYSNDGGKDAIIYKDGKKYLVECKRYKSDAAIGRPLMQKLHAAMVEEHANGGFFVASCRYTQEALDYGRKFHIETIDLSKLLNLLSQHNNSTPTSHSYALTCRGCGESISFALWDDVQFKNCSNGHTIRNIFWNTSIQDRICTECGDVMKKTTSPHGIRYICSNKYCSRHAPHQNNKKNIFIDYL